jgi:hypothetical protein
VTVDEQKADAYKRLDEALREVCRLDGWEGLLTDWVVVAACQSFDANGHSITDVGQVLPGGGGDIPNYRIQGLLDYALTGYRAQVGYLPVPGEDEP